MAACATTQAPEPEKPSSPRLGDAGAEAGPADGPRKRAPAAPLARTDSAAARARLPGSDAAADEPLYRVGDRRITKSDLGDFVLRYFPEKAADALTQLVDEALVAAEAEREGIAVDDALVGERADAYLEERRREVRIQFGPDADLETILEKRLGRDLAGYRRDAERLARTGLLLDRLVRVAQLREDRVRIRVLAPSWPSSPFGPMAPVSPWVPSVPGTPFGPIPPVLPLGPGGPISPCGLIVVDTCRSQSKRPVRFDRSWMLDTSLRWGS